MKRFQVSYSVARVHLRQLMLVYVGVRGEDTGILACQRLGNDDIIAYVDVTVYGKALYHAPLSHTIFLMSPTHLT